MPVAPAGCQRCRVTPGRDVHGGLRVRAGAVLAYFVILGLAEGIWVARIPGVKARLHLTDGLLGASLLVGPAGLVAGDAAGGLAGRPVRQRPAVRPAGLAVAFLSVILWTARHAACGSAAAGVRHGRGPAGVALNAQGVQVERAYGRPLMASFHASFSIGGLGGAIIRRAAGLASAGRPRPPPCRAGRQR